MKHLDHLRQDRKLRKIIESTVISDVVIKKNIHLHLCSSIISQQLSTRVATVINQRFLDLFAGGSPSANDILDTSVDDLRAIGLSGSKAQYVHNVCDFFLKEKLTDKKLQRMTAEEILALLTQIKGVGRWTVEMLLMFALGHQDVFAADDFGIQKAMIRLYQLEGKNNRELKSEMLRISEKWSPYRTYACLYLWAWKDGK